MENNQLEFIPININTYEGIIPKNYDFVVTENGNVNEAYVLYGFDEIGEFDSVLNNPIYGFLNNHR
tara:strand:- start:279 stop:476 length:198 start_codon:yes stop_codon:yes gene_type:complete